jgi:glutamate--cysteine ligase
MSTRQAITRDDPVIETREQLIVPMAKGEKPESAWRIGTEHETSHRRFPRAFL